jgi:pyruvate, water dikinase
MEAVELNIRFKIINLKNVFLLLLAICAYSLAIAQKNICGDKSKAANFLSVINCKKDFDNLQGAPLKSSYANVQSVKVVYEIATDKIYYIQSAKYPYHASFCIAYLRSYEEIIDFNAIEYSDRKERRYATCNLNFYTNSNLYTIEFFQDDEILLKNVIKLYNKIKASTIFSSVKILDNSWHTTKWIGDTTLTFQDINSLYKNQQFQSMKTGTAYGKLVFIENEKKLVNVKNSEIVVLKNLPNALPICAASITEAYQTPLCHINILAQNRNTPNCVIKNAFENIELLKFSNKTIELKITIDTFYIKEITKEQLTTFSNSKKSKSGKIKTLTCDEKIKKLIPINKLSIKFINTVGGKAANMGELQKIQTVDNKRIPTPTNSFAIPFYFYKEHLINNKIDSLIEELYGADDEYFIENTLKKIQIAIEKGKISTALLEQVKVFMGADSLENFRFRSSTNAEDVEGFNGAGLYDSKTGTFKPNATKTVEKAIKQVWSSLWKERAYFERCYYRIDQTNLAMGILVNKAFGEEEVNGVAVTKNLYRNNYPSFTINVQQGEVSVVQPNDSIMAEQMIVNYASTNFDTEKNISTEYICHSSLQPNTSIMTNAEIKLLSTYLMAIKKHYWKIYGSKKNIPFNNFAMDIEFKLEKNTRRIVIKQARLY